MKNPLFKEAIAHLKINTAAAKVLMVVLGFELLKGRLPKLKELPFKEDFTMTAFADLSLAGIVLGTPTRYKVAHHLLKASESPDTHGKAPLLMTIYKDYAKEHHHHLGSKAPNDQKALLRLRQMVRKHGARTVHSMIPAFFNSRKQGVKTAIPCSAFCDWLSKHIRSPRI